MAELLESNFNEARQTGERVKRIQRNFYERRYCLKTGEWRTLFYMRFVDWKGVRRTFSLGDNLPIARQNLVQHQAENLSKIDFDVKQEIEFEGDVMDRVETKISLPLAKLFGPCVYILKEAGSKKVLYIGMSRNGIARLVDYKHGAVRKVKMKEKVIAKIIFFGDIEAARKLENVLILRHKPELNTVVYLR